MRASISYIAQYNVRHDNSFLISLDYGPKILEASSLEYDLFNDLHFHSFISFLCITSLNLYSRYSPKSLETSIRLRDRL